MAIIRTLAILCLFCSIIPLLFVNADNLCVALPSGLMRLNEIQSSGNDDNVVFILFALLSLFYFPLLAFTKNKILFGIFIIGYYLLGLLPFLWLESGSFYQIIKGSIIDCDNGFLTIFIIGQCLFLVFSLLFIFLKPQSHLDK